MQINFKKSSCVHIGPRHDVSCASVVSLSGQMIPWVKEARYLGIHIVGSRTFRCSLSMAKRSFFKSTNAVFGKIGGRASEEVIIEIIRTKCMPVLLYGLEVCPLRKSDINLLNFVVNRFFIKLFRTSNIDIVNYCRAEFNFELPGTAIEQRTSQFRDKYRSCDNLYCKLLCV